MALYSVVHKVRLLSSVLRQFTLMVMYFELLRLCKKQPMDLLDFSVVDVGRFASKKHVWVILWKLDF